VAHQRGRVGAVGGADRDADARRGVERVPAHLARLRHEIDDLLRDLARVGLMMLNDGKANGRQIIPARWVRESTRPAAGTGPGYGYQWWMAGSPGAYQAVGLQGQYIYVDPGSRTVIVKLSYFPPDNMAAAEETAAFFAAASRWQPPATPQR
jgi:CubicO group peptidase (beta-lactamase class C family)